MSETALSNHKWYALQCLSNHEDKVRRYLHKFKEEDESFADCLKEVLVPIETVSEVINFIGKDNPTPLADHEIGRILKQVQDAAGKEVPKVQFAQGEVVKILDGPFLNLTGEIDEIDADKGTLKVSVSIFGRFTPVELEFWQVEKAEEE
jgi:transcriptional antiterminator NusG